MSLLCHVSFGKWVAKYAACWPVPEPISNTRAGAAISLLSCARIGSLFRSQAGLKGLSVMVCVCIGDEVH